MPEIDKYFARYWRWPLREMAVGDSFVYKPREPADDLAWLQRRVSAYVCDKRHIPRGYKFATRQENGAIRVKRVK